MTIEASTSPGAARQKGANLRAAARPVRRHRGPEFTKFGYLRRAPWQYLGEVVRTHLTADDERRLLAQARGGNDVCWAERDEAEPLVTVRIATYNRGPL